MQNMVGQPNTVQVPNYSGVNIQIFNPAVNAPGTTPPASNVNSPTYYTNPSYPANYYTQNLNPTVAQAPAEPEKKKTEKREVVELTDEYLKNVEGYLNSQETKARLMGAKEVLARLQEDDSRKGDLALNALINKMLQDPYEPVKFMALSALNTHAVNGDDLTVQLLKSIQQDKTGYGEDASLASNILLKMSGNRVEKEFEVKDKPKAAEPEAKSKKA